MGKLKLVTKSVSFSCQDPPEFTNSVSFPSAFRITRFRLPVSGPLIGACRTHKRAFSRTLNDICPLPNAAEHHGKTAAEHAGHAEHSAEHAFSRTHILVSSKPRLWNLSRKIGGEIPRI